MKKLNNIIFSMELTGMLLLMFAISIGYATFVENDFGTVAAKSGIYNATWFEILLLLLAVNMTGSIFKHKMYVRKKWTVLLFHVSFLVILAGAAVTRYISYEGMMRIREGETSNGLVTDKTYIRIWADNGSMSHYSEEDVLATPASVGKFAEEFSFGGQPLKVQALEYYINAGETVIEGEGDPLLWLVISDKMSGRKNFYFRNGDVKNVSNSTITFNSEPIKGAINITSDQDGLKFTTIRFGELYEHGS